MVIDPVLYSLKVMILNGRQWRIQGRGPGDLGLPLIFGPNWGPKGRAKFFLRLPPPPYLRVWMTVSPAPPSYLKVWILDGAAKKRAYPLSCETTSKIEMSTQDGIIFQGPKSISPRPKDKEKPNNHISVGKGAWSCVLTQHEQRTEINFLKVWNLQHLFSLPNKRNLLFERKTRAALIEKVKRRFA